ncbi:dihydrofolate reductase family protein [Novosphingobium sp. 1949]|uniref:Dihydrofolate reductase family protein n=1 Tax=Novosphingobium organovorum TaxID=2930092 RepID=A0ABT0B8U6_9SPHN|nr:dihydrofolate reductase family protein [Novosphingobium organovorum]MCJ2181495.1 dihydrofolate reductase family protein [Novosphingobium organovorum]
MARTIRGAAFVSLDGVMQAPGGPGEDTQGGFTQGGWVFRIGDPGIEETLGRLFGQPFDLLLGRRTYDIFAAYWPYVTGEAKALGTAFDRASKYVLTHATHRLEWENSHALAGIADVARIKAGAGPDIVIQGSSTLYPPLLAAGLIDELIVMTYPLMLGRGKRLLGEGTPVGRLDMTDHQVTAKGTVIATYRPAGGLPPYPADAPPPSTSAREEQRQKRLREGRW